VVYKDKDKYKYKVGMWVWVCDVVMNNNCIFYPLTADAEEEMEEWTSILTRAIGYFLNQTILDKGVLQFLITLEKKYLGILMPLYSKN